MRVSRANVGRSRGRWLSRGKNSGKTECIRSVRTPLASLSTSVRGQPCGSPPVCPVAIATSSALSVWVGGAAAPSVRQSTSCRQRWCSARKRSFVAWTSRQAAAQRARVASVITDSSTSTPSSSQRRRSNCARTAAMSNSGSACCRARSASHSAAAQSSGESPKSKKVGRVARRSAAVATFSEGCGAGSSSGFCDSALAEASRSIVVPEYGCRVSSFSAAATCEASARSRCIVRCGVGHIPPARAPATPAVPHPTHTRAVALGTTTRDALLDKQGALKGW